MTINDDDITYGRYDDINDEDAEKILFGHMVVGFPPIPVSGNIGRSDIFLHSLAMIFSLFPHVGANIGGNIRGNVGGNIGRPPFHDLFTFSTCW